MAAMSWPWKSMWTAGCGSRRMATLASRSGSRTAVSVAHLLGRRCWPPLPDADIGLTVARCHRQRRGRHRETPCTPPASGAESTRRRYASQNGWTLSQPRSSVQSCSGMGWPPDARSYHEPLPPAASRPPGHTSPRVFAEGSPQRGPKPVAGPSEERCPEPLRALEPFRARTARRAPPDPPGCRAGPRPAGRAGAGTGRVIRADSQKRSDGADI